MLQYTNLNQIGLEESIDITNALGVTSPLRIKSIPQVSRATVWFTSTMFTTFMYALASVTGNQSLVRNASTFFGLYEANLMEVYTVGMPLNNVQRALHDRLGPLGNIDLLYVPVPAHLLDAVQGFRRSVSTALQSNAAFRTAYDALTLMRFYPTPIQWQDPSLVFFGGSPTCSASTGYSFVQESFGFDDGCMTPTPLTLHWSPLSSLFALSMTTAMGVPPMLCHLLPPTEANLCSDELRRTAIALATAPALVLNTSLPTLTMDLPLATLQIVRRNGSFDIETQRLLDPSYSFFGWMSVYEWAMNTREVVLFDGDVASYMVMTYAYAPLPLPAHLDSSVFGAYMWGACAMTSAALTLVGLVVLSLRLTSSTRLHTPWLYYQSDRERHVAQPWPRDGSRTRGTHLPRLGHPPAGNDRVWHDLYSVSKAASRFVPLGERGNVGPVCDSRHIIATDDRV